MLHSNLEKLVKTKSEILDLVRELGIRPLTCRINQLSMVTSGCSKILVRTILTHMFVPHHLFKDYLEEYETITTLTIPATNNCDEDQVFNSLEIVKSIIREYISKRKPNDSWVLSYKQNGKKRYICDEYLVPRVFYSKDEAKEFYEGKPWIKLEPNPVKFTEGKVAKFKYYTCLEKEGTVVNIDGDLFIDCGKGELYPVKDILTKYKYEVEG